MEYGSFCFNLGPGKDGKYHEITAIGMDKVTSGFGDYKLEEVIKEYTKFGQGEELEQVLPKTVGGTMVHLLLGIKNTRLQPILLKVLPSGVGVYLSPFKDVWGSRIIFAGSHKVFSKTNQEQLRDSNHAVYSAGSDKVQEHWDNNLETREDRFNPIDRIRTSFFSSLEASDDVKEIREVRFDSTGRIRTSLYSSAIEDDILQEMGFEEDQEAVETLEKDRFVDDLLGGNETREGVKLQVDLQLY